MTVRTYTLVTIENAKQVWDSLDKPNYRKVQRSFHAVGKEVSVPTLRRWHLAGWVRKAEHAEQLKSGPQAAFVAACERLDTTSVPTTMQDPTVRLVDMVAVIETADAGKEQTTALGKKLGPLATAIVALPDAQLLVEAHRRILQAATMGITKMMEDEELFLREPEQCSAALKNYTASVALATESLKGSVVTVNGELVGTINPPTVPLRGISSEFEVLDENQHAVLPAVATRIAEAFRSWREPPPT